MNDQTLGQRMYYARVWRGRRTLKEFGEAIAHHQDREAVYTGAAVSEWEHDRVVPSLATLVAVAAVSGVRAEWLILRSGEVQAATHEPQGVL